MQINKKITGLLVVLTIFTTFTGTISSFAQQNQQDALSSKEPVVVPGTNVTITLPDVFRYDAVQSAYIYTGAAASITIREINGTSYAYMIKEMTKSNLENQGMQLLESQEIVTSAGQKGMLYKTSITAQNAESGEKVDYKRYIFFTGNEEKAIWITANFPLVTENLLQDVILESMKSVEY